MPTSTYSDFGLNVRYFSVADNADMKVKGLLNRNPFLIKGFKVGSGKRILFIFDRVPTEDLWNKELFSGTTGQLFFNMANKTKLSEYEVVGICFNACKTVDLDTEGKESAFQLFKERLFSLIHRTNPHKIISCGLDPSRALKGSGEAARKALGFPYEVEVHGNTYTAISTLSVSTLLGDVERKFKPTVKVAQLAGMWCNHVNRFITDTVLTSHLKASDVKVVLADTVPRVKNMLSILRKAASVCIDIEATGLARRTTDIIMIQFGIGNKAYIMVAKHTDCPFSPKEASVVRSLLIDFFETNDNAYHIYHNAKYDVEQFLSWGVRYYRAPVYCTMAGAYALDENRVALADFGYKPYSLATLCSEIGITLYDEIDFSKGDRNTINDVPLTKDVYLYAGADVVALRHVHDLQIQAALEMGYDEHLNVVLNVIGEIIHCATKMEYFGLPVDKPWVHYLKTPNSPVNNIIRGMKESFIASDNVKKANALLVKGSGAPTHGMFANKTPWVFDISKDLHKQTLFFTVMKIPPLYTNAKGGGKLDKAFKAEYKDTYEEVSWLNELGKAEKLRSSYVNKFYDVLKFDPDARRDCRIRPNFSFAGVVTGRVSAKDPSLHQIPSRSELGKVVKRMFVAEQGNVFCAADYSAHEIRGFTLIAGDEAFAKQFAIGLFARLNYRVNPTEENKRKVEKFGDVHKLNVQFFHGTNPDDCTKEQRNAIKGTTFGTLYGMGVAALAASINQSVEDTQNLLDKFFGKFVGSKRWLQKTKKFSKKHLYALSPLGRRRNLSGYLHPDNGVQAACARMSMNSPIQGTASDQGFLGGRSFQKNLFDWDLVGVPLGVHISNSVHDSVYTQCPFWAVPIMVYIMEHSYTTNVHVKCRDNFGSPLPVGLEMDFELGDNLRDVVGWDFTPKMLSELVVTSMKSQEARLGVVCVNKKEVLAAIAHNSKLMERIRQKEIHRQLDEDTAVSYRMYSNLQIRWLAKRVKIVVAEFREQE